MNSKCGSSEKGMKPSIGDHAKCTTGNVLFERDCCFLVVDNRYRKK
jgi:hypothetical protein